MLIPIIFIVGNNNGFVNFYDMPSFCNYNNNANAIFLLCIYRMIDPQNQSDYWDYVINF